MQTTQAKNESPETTPISEVMTRTPIRASPDDTMLQVVVLLLDHGVSGLPVVDGRGHPIGMISKTDIIREACIPDFGTGRMARKLVRDVMRPIAFTVEETTPISQVAALMALEHVHRLPVVGPSGSMTGLASAIDVLRWLAEREGYLMPRREIRRQVED